MVAISRPSVVVLGVMVVAVGVGSQIGAQAPSCEPLGEIRFVCGQDGFVLVAFATLILSLVATAAAFFIRPRAPARLSAPASAPSEPLPSGIRPAETARGQPVST